MLRPQHSDRRKSLRTSRSKANMSGSIYPGGPCCVMERQSSRMSRFLARRRSNVVVLFFLFPAFLVSCFYLFLITPFCVISSTTAILFVLFTT